MFHTAIIGVNGGQGGRDAIALARHLVDADADVTLAHVVCAELRPWRAANPDFEARARLESEALLAAARERTGIQAKLRTVLAQSVGRGLHELSVELGADLLVVGSSRRGAVGRVQLGDDTHAALVGTPCAVAVAPRGYVETSEPLRTVGVAYNGTPESEHALKAARTLASERAATVSAMEVVSLPGYVMVGGFPILALTADELVDEARERLSALAGVEAHAVYGRPSEELGRFSAGLDILVCGSRNYGPAGRLVHGSTSRQLARTARCPLLVLPRTVERRRKGSADATLPAGA